MIQGRIVVKSGMTNSKLIAWARGRSMWCRQHGATGLAGLAAGLENIAAALETSEAQADRLREAHNVRWGRRPNHSERFGRNV